MSNDYRCTLLALFFAASCFAFGRDTPYDGLNNSLGSLQYLRIVIIKRRYNGLQRNDVPIHCARTSSANST
jgi:hypothetical protein